MLICTKKLLSLSIHDEVISLAHGQVPNEVSLARSEKALAPGVGQWDLSAPAIRWQTCVYHSIWDQLFCVFQFAFASLELMSFISNHLTLFKVKKSLRNHFCLTVLNFHLIYNFVVIKFKFLCMIYILIINISYHIYESDVEAP